MTTMTTQPELLSATATSARSSRARGFAALRILFGLIWSIDAAYKWVPAFRTQTLVSQFGRHLTKIHTPLVHGWINLWYQLAKADPNAFGYTIAAVETLLAVGLLTGCYSKVIFVAGGFFSAGVWTAAEGAGLPIQAGQTDIGTSVIYVLVFIALYLATAGSTWSLDAKLRGRGGRLAMLRN